MHCFYHPEKTAVGICKYCQRGLCTGCISEVDDNLACKDRHEEQVNLLEIGEKRSRLHYEQLKSVYRRNAIFYFLVGILFTGFGIFQIRWMGIQGLFLLAIGVFLLYAAVGNYMESRK